MRRDSIASLAEPQPLLNHGKVIYVRLKLPMKRDVPRVPPTKNGRERLRQASPFSRRRFFWREQLPGLLRIVAPRLGLYQSNKTSTRGKCMKVFLAALLVGGSVVATSGVVLAHHSFAMFDQEHPIQLTGTVKEYRYTSPHTFIILDVKDKDGTNQLWNLEGGAPSGLIRDGWSSKTLKPGDELQLMVDPLRSGAPGGAWNVNKIKYKNGDPIVVTH